VGILRERHDPRHVLRRSIIVTILIEAAGVILGRRARNLLRLGNRLRRHRFNSVLCNVSHWSSGWSSGKPRDQVGSNSHRRQGLASTRD
jgi:hypothetical protein